MGSPDERRLTASAGVAASGIRALGSVYYENNSNIIIVACALGMGVIPIAVPDFYEEFPGWCNVIFESGISAAAITAVLLNIVFNVIGRPGDTGEPVLAEAQAGGTNAGH